MFYWAAYLCNVVLRYKFQPNAEIVAVVSNGIWQGIIEHGEDFPYCKTMSAVSTNAYIICHTIQSKSVFVTFLELRKRKTQVQGKISKRYNKSIL